MNGHGMFFMSKIFDSILLEASLLHLQLKKFNVKLNSELLSQLFLSFVPLHLVNHLFVNCIFPYKKYKCEFKSYYFLYF